MRLYEKIGAFFIKKKIILLLIIKSTKNSLFSRTVSDWRRVEKDKKKIKLKKKGQKGKKNLNWKSLSQRC